MKRAAFFFALLLLATGGAFAQAPGEITFWESVRDSKNPEELRAYLNAFPNGMFAPLARARLAALDKPAAAPSAPRPAAPATAAPRFPSDVASSAPASVTAATRMPQAGDTWTYTLSYPRLRGQFGQPTRPPSIYVVKVGGVSEGRITEQLAIDGGTLSEVSHSSEPTLAAQGMSLFSPYLVAFRDLSARSSVGSVAILDQPCRASYVCEANARVIGTETVDVPAGRFTAVKVLVAQSWRSSGTSSNMAQLAGMIGGRNLTVWYVPELKRAVKFQSRSTVGEIPPVEPNFDLDLVSYQVK